MKQFASFATVLVLAGSLAGCDDDRPNPTEPVQINVDGMYTLVELSFDPQGSLPEVDLLARMDGPLPTLNLVPGGRAQLVYRDPETGLVAVADAQYAITRDERVQFTFDSRSTLHRQTLLSDAMRFEFVDSPRTLVFDTTAPGGIDRATLIRLVPEWEEEQLFDPVPGRLTVVYRVDG